ncbi:septum formation protein Maf [Winogradskyella sp. DF17]|uniref:dTTP/UTP pyrophosphatase n=1 Tax=Winogradskyella pelagia TaxID=2819984 RepID=A0ABS3T2P1_9FLAO|nr:Maf family nucleotide pyrophosphatase [Winogradskyella sp. DF17]MBO3116544.1 septum formation protein Maf [Winogradskyella sp. DF17]
MLSERLKQFNIILGSASPRRQNFLKELHLEFEIRLKPVKEIYPKHLLREEITDHLSKLKAEPFIESLKPRDILITSDTIVWQNTKAIGKPKNKEEAFTMIKCLSDNTHEVITSICFTTSTSQIVKNTTTKVIFRDLTDEEIWFYINTYNPLDKAGAYGIQEWIGAIGISRIEGSYNNVVGLPTHLFYETLINIANSF